ncbi:membrane protein [Paramicrobacterium humi]|uniref:Membrane protein n=1 Tax=Paramicrobacterium humi TaxID=640635 RepID=A0A1H4IWR6_9MICO|nr:YihY/virulence factor BrkB family protein [Microbacterium humi]SEB38295.1 membrane protein [Microbacterium humi]
MSGNLEQSSSRKATTTSTSKEQHAPAPDDARKPQTPPQVSKPSWKYVAKRALAEFSRDRCTTLAAALTYYSVLAIFPGLLAVLSLVGLFGQAKQTTELILQVLGQVADKEVVQVLKQPIGQLASTNAAGFALVFGLLGAIWSASGYVSAFSQAMNTVYEIDEGRPFWKLRPVVLLLTVILLIIAAIIVMLLIISGPIAQAIGQTIGLGSVALTVWNIAKWPVIAILAVIALAILYYGSPNVKQPKFRWMSMGAFVALIIMVIASLGFFFYVANFGHYQKTYGSIAGVIVMLLWLWIVNLSLLFGAEFDAEMERARELQAGIEAEESIQLPPRDDRKSKKMQEKEAKTIKEGRDLRRRSVRNREESSGRG